MQSYKRENEETGASSFRIETRPVSCEQPLRVFVKVCVKKYFHEAFFQNI